MMECKTYKVKEVAQMLGISENKAYEHINNKRIPGVIRLGRRRLVRRKVFDAWMDGGLKGGGNDAKQI